MKREMPVVFILICLLHARGLTQTTTDTAALKTDKAADSPYIKHYDNYLNITTGWNTRNTEYTISYPQHNTRFILSPKETHQFYISLDYSFLYAYYSFTPHAFNSEDTIKGKSKRSTFTTGFSLKRWSFNFDYQSIRGYYLQNTNEFIPGWSKGDAYLQFPDLKTIQVGGQVGYNFNKRFSVASLTSGKEQQLRTVLTFFPILAYWDIKMRDEANTDPQETGNVLTINNDINLLLPVSANIVFAKNFYVSAFAGPIIGINFFKANGYDKQTKSISASGTHMSTGYYVRSSIYDTGKKFFTGLDIFSRSYGHQQEYEKFIKHSYGIQAYVGTRLKAHGFLQKNVTWLQDNRPF